MLIDFLKDEKPKATFDCNKNKKECQFQFWVGQVESFGCKFKNCLLNNNTINYRCEDLKCECLPDRPLCENEGFNIGELLEEHVKGPAELVCDLEGKCSFSEEQLDSFIKDTFGDETIKLQCKQSECIDKEQLIGIVQPDHYGWLYYLNFKFIVSFLGILLVSFILLFLIHGVSNVGNDEEASQETETLLQQTNRVQTEVQTLTYRNLSYNLENKTLLENVSGHCQAGTVTAILGASGAGKTTLLNILAMRNKRGNTYGEIMLNGTPILKGEKAQVYRYLIGYVDQDDLLMSTLTVYETVLNSAMLRLPTSISYRTKCDKVLQILQELSILEIKDQLIGDVDNRGISGGERKRVCIACELVTSPCVLFLDEPTSGLDSFNALKIMQLLSALSKTNKTAIITSIHQPRSNIYALFDNLVLLGDGRLLYSGGCGTKVIEYLRFIGSPCPEGYNVADYLLDISQANLQDTTANSNNYELSETFFGSKYGQELLEQVEYITENSSDYYNRDRFAYYTKNRPSKKIQFQILSARLLKNLYRDPVLLLTNFSVSVFLGLACGLLFYGVKNDISGFQNRMGLFFFTLTMFSFSNLTSLQTFHLEKKIFKKERANMYYSTFSYFGSKIMFDIIPLRVVPPMIYGIIVYPMVGLNPSLYSFFKFVLTLVLFNVTGASFCLLIGIAIANISVANLASSLTILFSMLFSGLILNKEDIPYYLRFLKNLSFFNYGLEALLVNEIRYLKLKEIKYGIEIEIPGPVILSTFGFDAAAYSGDVFKLCMLFIGLLSLAFFSLHNFVKEKL